MLNLNRCAKINVTVLIILLVVMVAVGASLFAARQVRRDILSKMDLEAGQAAFEKEDWLAAYKHFREYLGRNPDDVEILKKYAEARLSIRPLEPEAIRGVIAAYRRVIQLDPLDEDAYDQLAMLYTGTGNFEELAYIARTRRKHVPTDRKAPLWLADALVRLNRTQEARQTLEQFIEELEQALPDKCSEYVRACVGMSQIMRTDDSTEAKTKALEWLSRAVAYDPESVEALAHRGQFYREAAGSFAETVQEQLLALARQDVKALDGSAQTMQEQLWALARKDLEAADHLGTKDPRIRFFLGAEWIAHGELERAAAELQAAESLPQETLEEHFFDIKGWAVARFLLASELARRRGDTAQGASLADEALTTLTEERHRVQVLPSAIPLYVAAGKVTEARARLDEYLEAVYTQQGAAEQRVTLAYLQALVAQAEQRPYVVIDALQPIVISDASRPELWRLLAEAYSRTGQTRRAIDALVKYLRFYPRDPQMTLQLAAEYSRLRDWNKALEAARVAESLNPTDVTPKLLRIGASINLAVEPRQDADAAKLEELSAELAQLRQEHPDQVDIRALQASVATYLGQPETAESELKLAIKEGEKPLRAEMQLVGHYRQTGRMPEAIKVCETACEHHSEVARPWLSLSELHMANADYDSARSCLRQGLKKVIGKEEKRSLSIRLALLEVMQGNRPIGIRLLSEMAAQDEQEVRARSLLLFLREIQEDRTTAEELVRQLRKAEGESGLWWRFHQASLWLSSDEWRSKQPDITSALRYCIDSDPQWSAPVLLLVGMYEKLQDLRRVEDTCRQALIRNPSATDIGNTLLALLERQGRFSEAEQVLQQMQTDARVAGAWQVRMALGAGDLSRAIDALTTRVSNDEQDASSRIQLARLIYQQTGDAAQAFAYLKQAEAIAPSSRTLTAVRASILKAEGQTEQAQQTLDDYVADHNDFNAYWMRAVYLAEEGELERAETDYKKLTTFAENGAAGYVLLSNFYAGNEKLDQAVATLQEGSNAYPEDLGLKRNLMKLLFRRARVQDRETALEILAALEERLPRDPELMMIRALQLLAEPTPQSIKSARQRLEEVVEVQPTAVDAHLVLIGMAMRVGEYENARDFAIRALGSTPNHPALLSARANAELALGNTQMAAKLAHLVLQEDPNNIAAIVTLVDLYRFTGDAERAKQRIEQAEQIDPNNQDVIRARFLWLASQNRFDEIAQIGSDYLSAKDQNPTAVLTAASILAASDSMKLKKEGLKLFQHAATSFPELVDAHLGVASTLYQIGDAERAENIYQELLGQYPNDVRILNDLAWILQEQHQRYDAALELANRGLILAPDDLHLLDTRGTILTNMPGRLDDAKKDFERLVELSSSGTPRRAKSLFQLGRICAKLNELFQARQHLEDALEIDQKIDVFTADERAEITRIIQGTGMQAVNSKL